MEHAGGPASASSTAASFIPRARCRCYDVPYSSARQGLERSLQVAFVAQPKFFTFYGDKQVSQCWHMYFLGRRILIIKLWRQEQRQATVLEPSPDLIWLLDISFEGEYKSKGGTFGHTALRPFRVV